MKQYSKLRTTYARVADLAKRNGTFSELLDVLASAKLNGMKSPTGYWTVNMARLLCKETSGVNLPGGFDIDDKGLEMVLQMGEGVKEGKKHMKIKSATDLRRLTALVIKVAKAMKRPIQCTPLQATILLCEAKRRGTFDKKGTRHRRGR